MITKRRLLGLDVGDRRIGCAISDSLGLTAQRLTLIERHATVADVEVVRSLVEQHAAQAVIVGLPLTLHGEQGVQAGKVNTFVQALRQRLTVPVHLIDERLTTVQGERALLATGTSRRKRKQMIDQVAAQLILQQYLDQQVQPQAGHET